tara:strand:+ start:2345 stop:3334 length:990 start_codon:yes stop_codon:yes gene_type:complete
MRKNLFIVRSPLQFLNAIEAREKFACNNTVLVLMFNTNIKNTEQMRSLLKVDEWNEIIEYDQQKIPRLKRFIAQATLVKTLKKQPYHYVFSGDFGTINQIIISNVKAEEIYLVDDGMATIAIYNKIRNQHYFREQSLSSKMKFYRYKLAGLTYLIKQAINFYTIYEIKSTDLIQVKYHEFNHLKSHQLQQCQHTELTYLIGQNMIQSGLMDADTYILYIKKIIANYSGDIIYIPHRTEVGIRELKKLESDRFTIKKSTGAIEIVLLNDGIYPAHIVSFFSSALFNLDKIFSKSNIDAVRIAPKDLKKLRKEVDDSYRFFENTGVRVASL